MGNSESNVSAGVKGQAGSVSGVYALVDLNGGGELVELMKKATKTKDFGELDDTIKSKVGKYCFNNGLGKTLPIHKFVIRRNAERSLTKQFATSALKNLPDDELVAGKYIPGKHDPSYVTDFQTYRHQTFDFAHLGAVGETVLHLCVLNATSVHMDLAKRIIRHFPSLINDTYLADEYYGENVLHIAIVNEDPSMVKFLLDNGANYQERCLGNFMCPEDQKPSRHDNLQHEWVDLQLNTNYVGYVYWGEYPLSFAACLSQEECYRLILAKGANPDNQDTNGNCVTHMMVIYDKMDMFDMAFELGGSISVPNRQGLIPLTLAAILARRDLFFHILNIQREIYWQIGNVTCAAYPLDYLDTINTETGDTQKQSALNLITYGEKEAHLDLMEGPIVDLLKTKWETFVKFRFYRLFIIFFIYFVISLGTYVLRPVPCFIPGSRTKVAKSLSIMSLPSLGITCVNVSVLLSPDVIILDPTTTDYPDSSEGVVSQPNKDLMNVSLDSLLQVESAISVPYLERSQNGRHLRRQLKTSNLTTEGPDVENEMPSPEEINIEFEDDQANPFVTDTPGEIVTVQYYLEGEEVSATLGSNLHDLLSLSPSTSNPIYGTTDEGTTSSATSVPVLFTCYNKSHHLSITGHNRTLFISEIVKRHKYSKEPSSAVASSPWAYHNSTDNITEENPCACYLWKKPKPLSTGEFYLMGTSWTVLTFYVRIICEGLTLVGSIAYLVGASKEARFQGMREFFKNLSTVPARVLFLFSCNLVVIMAILRVMCQTEAEDVVAVLAMICTGPYFLFFCRGFKTVGPMVTMIYTMLVGDLLRFVTIYFVFIMGFSQAYFILFSSHRNIPSKEECNTNPLPNAVESVMTMFITSLGNFGDLYNGIECTQHEITGKVMFMLFMAIVALLLINLLIAMMGNTYQRIAELKNEWMRQWARIVLVVERSLKPEVRLQKLMLYSQPMSDGRRALVLRLHQDEEEREEMRDIFDMRRVHKRYVERRKIKIAKIEEENQKINTTLGKMI